MSNSVKHILAIVGFIILFSIPYLGVVIRDVVILFGIYYIVNNYQYIYEKSLEILPKIKEYAKKLTK